MAVDKARHAFGNLADVEKALQDGKIDNYDILFLDGDTDNPKIGWIDKNGNPVILKDEKADLSEVEADVEALESAMAEKANASDVETLETALATKVTAEEVKTMIKESGDSLVEIVEF